MNERLSPNRETLVQVANLLRPLLSEVVFVGGQVAELLVTDPAATGIRATDDVDVIVSAYRPELPTEVLAEGNDLRLWISEQVTSFLAEDDFYYALQGALPDTSQVPELLAEVRAQFGELIVGGTI